MQGSAEAQLKQIQQLLLQLQQAVLAGKWLQVQALDRQIRSLVETLQQLRQTGAAVQPLYDFQLLTQRYQQIIQQAKRQQLALEQKMKEFQHNKAGVLAYQQTDESMR